MIPRRVVLAPGLSQFVGWGVGALSPVTLGAGIALRPRFGGAARDAGVAAGLHPAPPDAVKGGDSHVLGR